MKNENRIGILDLDISNVESLKSAVNFLGFNSQIIKVNDNIEQFEKIVIPGCGSFPSAMKKVSLNKFYLRLKEYVKNKKILGICLGMQIFLKKSDEFKKTKGLGLINLDICKLDMIPKIPNVGFRKVKINKQNYLFNNIKNNTEFYFMHSYGVANFKSLKPDSYISFGKSKIVSSVSKKNFFGTQFHPEKSGKNGLTYLYNFFKI
ncbi:imidazole glycerol phosphate synthase subunit HisH [Candidatus Pelagibacter bacterium]|nr:imidazole glycerol phosphate synthase subunit HisH [Candidatus Pelagibacter bacterium]MDA9232377.1 imidazole glycerol phosphate synthase subunit HisH [Candidatus Pelagibacter sp.]